MPIATLIRSFLLPELSLTEVRPIPGKRTLEIHVQKQPLTEYCPRCATASSSTYDQRSVRVKDEPFRTFQVRLVVNKRRLWCRPCRKPFTEPVGGITKGRRHTERYGRTVLRYCERYSDLRQVRRDLRCSAGFIYTTLYRHLELEQRKRRYPWPEVVGIDEHFFRRDRLLRSRQFVSMLVDYTGKRLFEVVSGRSGQELHAALADIPGRDNVRLVALDMSDPYKRFAKNFFPNARLVADKFHVLRLLHPALARRRAEAFGRGRQAARARRLLLCSRHRLDFWAKVEIRDFLADHHELRELYEAKEALHAFYRTRGIDRARRAFGHLLDHFQASLLPELRTLRRTLLAWRDEVLAYFDTGLTNGRTEGFNLKAKLVKRRAFGYRSFRNYRLRLLNSCAH
jgi:transposase